MLGSAPDGEPIINPQVMCLYIYVITIPKGEGPWCLLGKSEIAAPSPALAFNDSSLFNRKY